MHTVAAQAETRDRPWIRQRPPGSQDGAEPLWARRTKWALLFLAVALTAWTLIALSQALLVLVQAPVAIVTTLPAPETPPAGASQAVSAAPEEAPPAEPERRARSGSDVESDPPAAPVSEAQLLSDELRQLRKLLESRVRLDRSSAPKPAPTSPPNLLPGITTSAPPRRAAARRPEQALRVVNGPRVRLIGGDALVDALVENRQATSFERTVALELMVDGKRRQRRRLRLRIPPGARLHLSERFSTTLPDGTYSARLTVPPFG